MITLLFTNRKGPVKLKLFILCMSKSRSSINLTKRHKVSLTRLQTILRFDNSYKSILGFYKSVFQYLSKQLESLLEFRSKSRKRKVLDSCFCFDFGLSSEIDLTLRRRLIVP